MIAFHHTLTTATTIQKLVVPSSIASAPALTVIAWNAKIVHLTTAQRSISVAVQDAKSDAQRAENLFLTEVLRFACSPNWGLLARNSLLRERRRFGYTKRRYDFQFADE